MGERPAREGDGFAGIDGLQPFEVLKTGRGTELGCLAGSVPGLLAGVLASLEVVLHPGRGRVPARRAEPAEDAVLGFVLVHVEALWIVFGGKRLDLVGLEGMRAERDRFADAEIGVEGHAASPATRLRNMPVFCSSSTTSPRWLTSSWRTVTRPRLGRDEDARFAVTVLLPVSVSPASTGFFQRT